MFKRSKNVLIIIILIISNKTFGLSSSSYLISNTATNLLDYEVASKGFLTLSEELNEGDLHNKLLTLVNVNLISEAQEVAKSILKLDRYNQEAWVVYLTNAKIKKNYKIFIQYKKLHKDRETELIDFIFFSQNGDISENRYISESILEIIKASISENQNQNNYKFLLFYLSIASIIDPDFYETYFYLGKIYESIKNFSKAEDYYKKIITDHRLYLSSQKNIALNKSKQGLFNEGEKILKDLIDTYQGNTDLLIALADLYRIEKKYDKAIQYYTRLINNKNLYKDNWRIFYFRGICYERINSWELAEKDFLYSLELNPDSPQVLNYLAYGWLEKNIKIELALNMLKKAFEFNPNSYYILDSLAWAYYKNNELLIASQYMEKVLIMAPGEAISLDHLADIYFSLNRKREAVFFWKQALDLARPEDKIIEELKKKIAKFYEQ